MIVVDASITVGWLLIEEEAASTRDLYDQVLRSGLAAPAIFKIEVANALRSALRRKTITLNGRDEALAAFTRMTIYDDEQPSLADIVAVSDRHDLTVYDASYVALAKLRVLPIATLDAAMARAARAEDLAVLP